MLGINRIFLFNHTVLSVLFTGKSQTSALPYDTDNDDDFIIMSITSSSGESPLLIGDTKLELTKSNTQRSPIREIKVMG